MSVIFLRCPLLPYAALALYPFILLRDKEQQHNKVLVHHERIHHRQQLEMLILPFYLAYVLNYFFNLLKYRQHDRAYREIIFEREAYIMENDFRYLKERRLWGWMSFF